MNATKTAELTTGSVVSRDGTQIGYLRVGHGPAVVLLHGSNESARSHLTIALALAGRFTVYLPDRRGRGMSGPHDGIRTEVVDLEAILVQSGAELVFGSAPVAWSSSRPPVPTRVSAGSPCTNPRR